ncbi:acyl-CoA dehydrogenase family protein [Antrihabitans cavernicola]|uniref:Acyl-CoA dehydrogenase n=1 Tax=Antrihabitans cavernicola TaxID=2495913 RepID=A0A5A7SD40_9NOCA|nr:acyl-CoA dehydrogenase family protein [Spelaeibacter cavernicola]KAA0022503.1 acyl-CoA dehydrogenase [Spelaeibacter cavernicola]
MDFAFTDEQTMLRDTTRELLGRSYDAEKRNQITQSELGWSKDLWGKLAELGLLGLSFSEEDGGMGAGPEETMAVLIEVGRRLAPEPILDAVLLPGGLVADAGSADQRKRILPELAEGQTLLAFAHGEPGTRWPSAEVATTATQQGDSWTVSGRKNPVLHGDCADSFVVSAALPDGGVGLFLVDASDSGVKRTGYSTHDGLRGAQVDLDGAAAEPLGDGGDASALVQTATIRAQAALCAEAVGAMEESLRLTTEYLKQRKQFGVPLSKFQTLTQRAADMYVSLEAARSMNVYLTMSLADGVVDPIIASRAKLQIGRSARHIGQEAIQLHGGIGMTAEYPVGHYTSRLTAIDNTFGSADDHLRVLAGNVANYTKVEL